MEEICKDADLLLHWCYRLAHETQYPTVTKYSPDAGQIAEMAERAGVKQLLLTHIRKHMDTDNRHDEMIAAQFNHRPQPSLKIYWSSICKSKRGLGRIRGQGGLI